MAVSSVNGSSDNSRVGMGSSAGELSDSFMKMLVAQMQNQDPTNPMDNNQLTSQLAQFNTAAGIENLNKNVVSVGMMLASMQDMSSASWVGRDVMIKGDAKVNWGTEFDINSNKDDLNFSLNRDAEKVTVTFTDEAGKAYTAELKGGKAGINKFSMDDLENFQPSEPEVGTEYTVTYTASNAEGEAPTVVGLIKDNVEGVSMGEQGAVLHLKGGGTAGIGELFLIQ